MKANQPNLLGVLLKDFFGEHLSKLRGMSENTIHSYRDTMVLLLRFLSINKKCQVISLDLKDIGPQEIYAFLSHLEKDRNNSVSTRNNRLSAIHSFFRFVAGQHPIYLELAQRILGIPFKKAYSRVIDYLEYDEIQAILSTIDQKTPKGRRDYTLLSTMFNTGARVQEILNIRACDLQLNKPFQIQLMGKGRKQRCCPIWPQTASLLRDLCMELKIDFISEIRIFRNCRGQPMTRFGVRYILKKCLSQAQVSVPSLRFKKLHPHCIRHSTAVALIKSGVDLSTISQWLGHSSIATTNRYVTIDLEMKRKAIESVKPINDAQNSSAPWHRDKTILDWLESL